MIPSLRALFASAAFVFGPLLAFAAPRAEHVFIISIDGGKPSVIAQSVMPTLQGMVAAGAHTWTAQTVFPSVTLPSHVSMLTGVGPEKHMVSWNNWLPGAGFVKVPTVFSEAKKHGATTAMFVGKEKFKHLNIPGTVDVFSYATAKQSETVKEEEGPAPAKADGKKGGKKKTTKEGTVMANIVADEAAAYIVAQKPQLCFLHFADPDGAGHRYGWGTPEQIEAFARTDAALTVVKAAIENAGIADSSVVIISADHGGHDKTHGSNSPEDMNIPWIVWGKDVRSGFTLSAPVSTCDTAATVLWLLDCPVPASFEGKPVTSAFR